MAYGLSDDDWKKQMDKAMKPFLATYPPEKVAVDRIGPVVACYCMVLHGIARYCTVLHGMQ